MNRISLSLFSLFTVLLFSGIGDSQTSKPALPTPQSNWRVLKQKIYPLYKVQILTKDNPNSPLGIEATKAVITDLTGKTKAEVKNILVEPDPRLNVEGWVAGTPLDLDKDSYEDLLLRVFTGGSHCCYNYEIYSLGKTFKKMGELKLKDCGETIKLQDLNGDGVWEIITCNAAFTYFKDIPYSQSPFPPMVYGLENGKYINQDKKHFQIFDQDIATKKKDLTEKGYSNGDVVQIVLDYLLTNRENEAWQAFDQLYVSPTKESIRTEIQEKWKNYSGASESQKALSTPESKPAPAQP